MLDELHDDEPVNLYGGDAALILRVLPRPALRHLQTSYNRVLWKSTFQWTRTSLLPIQS